MTLALWCLFASAVLMYLAKIPVAMAMQRQGGGYDNHHPRQQQAQLTGLGARALSAQQNGYEAFPLFAAGVLVAQQAGGPQALVDLLALLHLGCRVLYLPCYWFDWHWQRTLVWATGWLASLLLLLTPLLL